MSAQRLGPYAMRGLLGSGASVVAGQGETQMKATATYNAAADSYDDPANGS